MWLVTDRSKFRLYGRTPCKWGSSLWSVKKKFLYSHLITHSFQIVRRQIDSVNCSSTLWRQPAPLAIFLFSANGTSKWWPIQVKLMTASTTASWGLGWSILKKWGISSSNIRSMLVHVLDRMKTERQEALKRWFWRYAALNFFPKWSCTYVEERTMLIRTNKKIQWAIQWLCQIHFSFSSYLRRWCRW